MVLRLVLDGDLSKSPSFTSPESVLGVVTEQASTHQGSVRSLVLTRCTLINIVSVESLMVQASARK